MSSDQMYDIMWCVIYGTAALCVGSLGVSFLVGVVKQWFDKDGGNG